MKYMKMLFQKMKMMLFREESLYKKIFVIEQCLLSPYLDKDTRDCFVRSYHEFNMELNK